MAPSRAAYLTEEDRARLRKLITDHSGLNASAQADGALEQAIAQRLAAYQLASLADYWPILRSKPAGNGEMNSLVQLLTNKETFFFREMHQFEVLRDRLLPELLATHDQPLRIWSAGCATGEEAYSLAITLLEYQVRYGQFAAKVIGTDIDSAALERARQGRYGERAVHQVLPELRQRYLIFDGRTYSVVPDVARLVTFEVHNLAEELCPVGLADVDVIFCRNITIYFDARARDRLNARLAGCLREGGYLFVASAETMSHDLGRLELLSVGNTFLFRKGAMQKGAQQRRGVGAPPARVVAAEVDDPAREAAPPEQDAEVGIPSTPPSSVASRPAPPDGPASHFQRAVAAFRRQDYEAARRELDEIPAAEPVWLDVYCLRGAILLQQERLAEAEAACQILLAHDHWNADGHFLMGLILRQQGQADDAVRSLKTAIYFQPEHRDAHFYLAETYRALGLEEQARREYKNTLNILLHSPRPASTLSLTGLEDQILRQACEANLEKLERLVGVARGHREITAHQAQQPQSSSGRNMG